MLTRLLSQDHTQQFNNSIWSHPWALLENFIKVPPAMGQIVANLITGSEFFDWIKLVLNLCYKKMGFTGFELPGVFLIKIENLLGVF